MNSCRGRSRTGCNPEAHTARPARGAQLGLSHDQRAFYDALEANDSCGPPTCCRERLQDWHRNGVGTALINLPTGMPAEITDQLLKDLAP